MRAREPLDLINHYASGRVLLDANLLLLLVVGTYNRQRVETFKRLNIFAPEDFDLLIGIIARFRGIVVTPNILTEVSNLAGNLPDHERELCFRIFGESISASDEVYVPSSTVASDATFRRFGLSDAVIIQVASQPVLVMTVDFRLAQYLQFLKLPVLNFNHIRYLNWEW